ncbi:N-acetylneuraminate synthase [Paenibacillus taihuensis]|uniref:N-acetylneuraminate synthase n=1 Tax=Paenibacillus taihuensis TaxID=1156355 RepID=A0A3D9RX07_9BACL|nr:N-acetylneuraminate synthase [Paenibacillus taihuensis]REE84510.1 N-acetylneuraminate synthase [Paenibacillus taihuensis]
MSQTYIVAEAGVNHNGSPAMAFRLVDAAVRAGADAVKFQTFRADLLVIPETEKAEYQKKLTSPEESQWHMLKSLELTEETFLELVSYCRSCNIEFLSTPFDDWSLQFLVQKCNVGRLKFSSGDLTNGPLLLNAARTGLPIIISTGMATLAEIEDALRVLAFGYLCPEGNPTNEKLFEVYASINGRNVLRDKVSILHCTTDYPTPIDEVNLRAIETISSSFTLRTGYSDHTEGIEVALAAVALGAEIIEKHFTLDRKLPGPDHQSSLEPDELAFMVQNIRRVERALGDSRKVPTPSEFKNRSISRKSLVTASEVHAGDPWSSANLTAKRPGTGISPMHYWDLLGQFAESTYPANQILKKETENRT